MENTKATIKTKIRVVALGTFGVFLVVSAAVNLFSTFLPVAALNSQIADRLVATEKLTADNKRHEWEQLKDLQINALKARPSEPFGWARLSYLWSKTGSDDKKSFSALKMSDFVSPFEAQQLPERSVRWLQFRGVENEQEKDYQDVLWQRSFTVAADPTWTIALRLGLTKYVAEALARKDAILAGWWRGRMSEMGLIN